MQCPADVSDVQSRFFRPLTTDEQTVVSTLLGDAWFDLQAAISDLVERLEDSGDVTTLTAQTVRVLAQSVIRVLKNPNSRRQESRGLDDSQRSWTLDDSIASGDLYFTDEELDSLRSASSTDLRGKAFSIMPWFDTGSSSSSSS